MDKTFYEDKLAKLKAKSNVNLQKFINSAFDMVSENNDIQERMNEINILLKEEPKPE